MNDRFAAAPNLARQLMHAYYNKRDPREVLSFCDARFCSWIGLDETVFCQNPAEIAEALERELAEMPHCQIIGQEYALSAEEDAFCVVTGNLRLLATKSTDALYSGRLRLTFVFADRGGDLRLVHQHFSRPASQFKLNEPIPAEMNLSSFIHLQKLLAERTAQVEMIASTTVGGMKGSLDDGFCTYFYVSQELCGMLGYTYREFMEMSGGTAYGAVYPPDAPKAMADMRSCFACGPEYSIEYRMQKKDGSLIWVLDKGKRMRNFENRSVINSILVDITESKNTLLQLKIEQERYEIVAELSNDLIFEYDIREDALTIFSDVSNAARKTKQCIPSFQKVLASTEKIHPDDRARLLEIMIEWLRVPCHTDYWETEFRKCDCGGEYSWFRFTTKAILDESGCVLRAVGSVKNISNEKKLLIESRTDPLTGLYNRAYLESCVASHLSAETAEASCSLILLDIDNFKKVNDRYGHIKGDRVLTQVAELLKAACRPTDLAARLGGDEFIVFLRDIGTEQLVTGIASGLKEQLRQGRQEDEDDIPVTVSLGISFSGPDTNTFAHLYHNADLALYASKRGGKNMFTVYQERLEKNTASSC